MDPYRRSGTKMCVVIIGSKYLKTNNAIKQYVDIIPEKQKYDKYHVVDTPSFLRLFTNNHQHTSQRHTPFVLLLSQHTTSFVQAFYSIQQSSP
ncbi:hypothetical protein RYX36_025504 [Vicia faba]